MTNSQPKRTGHKIITETSERLSESRLIIRGDEDQGLVSSEEVWTSLVI